MPTKPDSRCTWTLVGDRMALSLAGLSLSCQIQASNDWRLADIPSMVKDRQIEVRYPKVVWLIGSREFTMHRAQVATIIADLLFNLYAINPGAKVFFCTVPPRADHHKDVAAAIIRFNWALQKTVMKLKHYIDLPRMIRLHSIMLQGFLPKKHYFDQSLITPSPHGAHQMLGFILREIAPAPSNLAITDSPRIAAPSKKGVGGESGD